MALIAVLWIVAAMAILVAGMGQSVRQQIRVVASARDAVVAQAQADAAIQLTLQALQTAPQPPTAMQAHGVEFGGVPVQVIIQPLNGFIDIDRAPAPLLAALLEVAGGLPAGQAETLAQTLVDWRGSRPDGAGGPYHFEAVEDLLLVPGIDYALLERLRPLITTDEAGGGQVNPLAANAAVSLRECAKYPFLRSSAHPVISASQSAEFAQPRMAFVLRVVEGVLHHRVRGDERHLRHDPGGVAILGTGTGSLHQIGHLRSHSSPMCLPLCLTAHARMRSGSFCRPAARSRMGWLSCCA